MQPITVAEILQGYNADPHFPDASKLQNYIKNDDGLYAYKDKVVVPDIDDL
jgi:hypothetical protein